MEVGCHESSHINPAYRGEYNVFIYRQAGKLEVQKEQGDFEKKLKELQSTGAVEKIERAYEGIDIEIANRVTTDVLNLNSENSTKCIYLKDGTKIPFELDALLLTPDVLAIIKGAVF